jgi:hypothetical protein
MFSTTSWTVMGLGDRSAIGVSLYNGSSKIITLLVAILVSWSATRHCAFNVRSGLPLRPDNQEQGDAFASKAILAQLGYFFPDRNN